ncbi:hypothetical protein BDV33DRAFT_77881 [Aspergillus novoparasiticus]|uniref:Uncharacterized protein n=1 Tax=Aspergillus novoparasiticus TaxID=986946 RepID=A0A5N6F7B4_9EURO|nr:hypothetical protein BDV33DRAFT_77881 [Aspergillus novoparasiticus]
MAVQIMSACVGFIRFAKCIKLPKIWPLPWWLCLSVAFRVASNSLPYKDSPRPKARPLRKPMTCVSCLTWTVELLLGTATPRGLLWKPSVVQLHSR